MNQHVAHIGAFADRAQFETSRQVGRQILEAMHGEIARVVEQRFLDFFREQTFGQVRRGERRSLKFVAGGLDDFDFERFAGKRGATLRQRHVRLCKRQRAAAGSDADRS